MAVTASKPNSVSPSITRRLPPCRTMRGSMPAVGLAADAVLFQLVEIGVPTLRLLDAELIEIGPGKDAGIVEIVELDAQRVVADRLDSQDADMGAAVDELLLRRVVALHLGRRALDAEIFGSQAEALAVVEIDLQRPLFRLEPDLDRPMHGVEAAAGAGRRGAAHDGAPGLWALAAARSSSLSGRASSTSMIGIPSRIG